MVLVVSSSGALAAPLHDVTAVVVPLLGGRQSVAILGSAEAAHESRYVVVPVPGFAPAHVSATAGAGVAEWTSAVAACFPDAHVKAFADADTAAHAAESDACASAPASAHIARADKMQHHHGRSYGDAVGVVSADGLAAAAHAAPDVVAALARLYPRGRFVFVVLHLPPGATAVAVEAASPAPAPGLLWLPSRSGFACTDVTSTAADGAGPDLGGSPLVKWDTHVVSAGTVRTSDWRGGGKTPGELADDMHRRFASGTFKAITAPTRAWAAVRVSALAPPAVRDAFAAGDGAAAAPASPSRRTPSRGGIGGAAVAAEATGAAADGAPDGGRAARRGVSFGAAADGAGDGAAPHSAGSTAPAAPPGVVPQLGCVDVIRMKKIALGPDVDVLLALDDGSIGGEAAMEEC